MERKRMEMNRLDEKETLRRKIKLVMRITTAFVIVMVVSILAELVLVWIGNDALWCKSLMKLLGFLALISPLGVMIPLFFRVNYQSKLIMLQKKEKTERTKSGQAENAESEAFASPTTETGQNRE